MRTQSWDFKPPLSKSKEEEGYDIAGEYWLSENGAENPNDDASAAMSVGRYHEHARNRLNSTVMNVGHYGMARLLNNTLKWGATVQMEKINDKISEWEKRDSSGYSLPQTGNNVSVYSNLFSDNQIESTRFFRLCARRIQIQDQARSVHVSRRG